MKISDGVEIVGFGFLDAAAWKVNNLSGLITTGVILLFYSYFLEDNKKIGSLKMALSRTKQVFSGKKSS